MSKISLYWKCQLIGWSVASLYWSYTGFAGEGFNYLVGVLQFLSDVALYMLLTHLYRNFAISRGWQQLPLNQLLKRIIPATVVMGLAYLIVTTIKVYAFRLWLMPALTPPLFVFFRLNWSMILVAGIRLMSIWLLAYHLYHYAQREISIAKENARLSVMAKDAQFENLSAQLNPHFLFNSLNNIKALVIDNPGSARRAIDLLSDLLRTALYNRESAFTPLAEELSLVKDYLELEKLRLEERLLFSIDADNSLGAVPVPRFSIQTLTENAIKHGISQQKDGGLISIQVTSAAGFISITIQNPGSFDNNSPSKGLGLRNLTERLQLHYKGNAKFCIVNSNDSAVLSTLLIPHT